MDNSREVTDEFVRREAFTESDAVHPRFIRQSSEEIRQYEVENYYYCKQCNLFFAPTVGGLRSHFNSKRPIVNHKPFGSCFYCKGEVYEYTLNNESRVYHNCRDVECED